MKIVKPGDLEPTKLRFSCETCGCVFEADASDYSFMGYTGYDKYYRCDCPTCNNECVLKVEGGDQDGRT